MKENSYYKHKEFRDVFFCILGFTEYLDKYVCEVSWWNKGQCGIPYPLMKTQYIVLEKTDWDDYNEVHI